MSRETSPTAGPRFKAALDPKLDIDPQQRKILALVGAYADAGIVRPPMAELCARLALPAEEIDRQLELFTRRRLLWIWWAPYKAMGEDCPPKMLRHRNRYTCVYAGDPLPPDAQRVLERVRERRRELKRRRRAEAQEAPDEP